MIRQCATCLVMMGEKAPFADKSITHGICEGCLEDQMRKFDTSVIGKMLKEARKS